MMEDMDMKMIGIAVRREKKENKESFFHVHLEF